MCVPPLPVGNKKQYKITSHLFNRCSAHQSQEERSGRKSGNTIERSEHSFERERTSTEQSAHTCRPNYRGSSSCR